VLIKYAQNCEPDSKAPKRTQQLPLYVLKSNLTFDFWLTLFSLFLCPGDEQRLSWQLLTGLDLLESWTVSGRLFPDSAYLSSV